MAQNTSSRATVSTSASQAVGSKKYDAEKELARLGKRYNLTEDQKAKIQPILADQQKQVHKLGEDESLSDTEWASAVRKVHQQTVLKVRLQKTDAQASKYMKDEAKWAKQSQDNQGEDADDGPPPDGPPPGGGPPEE